VAAVFGEVAVVAVDHREAGAHVAREVKGRDAGAERERCKGMSEIVDPSDRVDPELALGWFPVAVAEVVQVEVAAARRVEHERLTARPRVWRRAWVASKRCDLSANICPRCTIALTSSSLDVAALGADLASGWPRGACRLRRTRACWPPASWLTNAVLRIGVRPRSAVAARWWSPVKRFGRRWLLLVARSGNRRQGLNSPIQGRARPRGWGVAFQPSRGRAHR
jgi:hypothetical protein